MRPLDWILWLLSFERPSESDEYTPKIDWRNRAIHEESINQAGRVEAEQGIIRVVAKSIQPIFPDPDFSTQILQNQGDQLINRRLTETKARIYMDEYLPIINSRLE